MCLVEQGTTEFYIFDYGNRCENEYVLNRRLLLHSGGVMIYFDRIEVVNMLVPSAGTTCSD